MSQTLTIAITADLHWGHHARGVAANRLMISFLEQQPPDLLILAGDVGTGILFEDCLAQFARVPCRKALVPGNHDLWVEPEAGHDSLDVYEKHLPESCRRQDFHYLDGGPLLLPEAGLAIVGCVNWYDYSWSLQTLEQRFPHELHRLERKIFSRGRHNDARFIRWSHDDASFTRRVVADFAGHLESALEQVDKAIVVTHHPPFYDVGFPRPPGLPLTLDSLLWDAFSGNRGMEETVARQAQRVAFAFCGHTHRAREQTWKGVRGYNVGGDYHFKRLLWLDWPAGTVTAHTFGDPQL